ncbi:hypothetical protein BU26DRAFT_418825 [Trematosphaeria pertusa]|uniref:Anaphase-promoting complex, subunit CDC26 n=1 Tax=Trematosphaeria pertusa TaxID=390896 RepID=A0A6A6IS28_9PLEO|nr:uncharacterized protein BU26DRAFT_418825 [Trematosphaeria pertusa]KAF2253344.1 hypothetical protein BU26DRAFT_418825 [Trematosphaeria pertusa]
MLRRKPTTITLTSADLELYEANRQRKLWEKQQQQRQASQSTEGSDEGKAQATNGAAVPQQKSQKDRIMGGQPVPGN